MTQAPIVEDVLLERRALGAERAAIDRMIGIAFDVDHLRVAFLALSPSVWMITPQLTEQYGQVLRVSVVRAIFSVLRLRVDGRQVEAERRQGGAPGNRRLNKGSTRDLHHDLRARESEVTEKWNSASR